jgi:hypothetical protein
MSKDCRSKAWLNLLAIPLLVAGLVAAPGALADDPVGELGETCEAPDGDVVVYIVNPNTEGEFLTALVHSGGFHGVTSTFANETIARALPGMTESNATTFFSVTRHYSDTEMAKVSGRREQALAPYLESEPTVYRTRVVEHLLANWGHERGGEVTFESVIPGGDGHLFDEYGSSLSYFKGGYSGQMSVLEVYRSGLSLDQVRDDLTRRKGMSGATIFQHKDSDTYLAYSQYFQTAPQQLSPASAKEGAKVAMRLAGQVAQNYSSR